jgi:prepilin-type N-terminal cleavage/methylation domain-containing protein
MRRQRGFTLLELVGSLALIASISVVAGGVALHAKETTDLASSYANDVAEVRRALGAVERDLRGAREAWTRPDSLVAVTDSGCVSWTLADGSLMRDGAVLARNVAEFHSERRPDGCVRVTIRLGRRAANAARVATVSTSVLVRAAAGGAK